MVAVDRGRYTVDISGRPVTAMRARELGRRGGVVGDRVALVGDVSGAPGSLARIVRIEERGSVLMRTADDDDTTPEGRVVKAIELSGGDNLLFRRNSVTGVVEVAPWRVGGVALNEALHAN